MSFQLERWAGLRGHGGLVLRGVLASGLRWPLTQLTELSSLTSQRGPVWVTPSSELRRRQRQTESRDLERLSDSVYYCTLRYVLVCAKAPNCH